MVPKSSTSTLSYVVLMLLLCHKLCFWPLETILFMVLILLPVAVLNSSIRFVGTTELIVVEAPAADDVSVIIDYLLLLLFLPVVEL